MSTPDEEILAGHLQELRRGTVVLACLATLQEPGYGYALLETLGRAGLSVEANTLYPLLRRLERQGLLDAEWNTEESRPRKFYRTSAQGGVVLDALLRDWESLHSAVRRLG
ncbi:PadR family transcriptional regulator [Ornithinicoccus halotolerans]|uniref:PadR family transcriptional regulator n=1 Tax=Ornithinicoccus halotolerans TaxID=1748220 RepID=UPI001296CFF1|nr:helix-turn-helix transcriptional regulator [Ornithinicoccus halotolerans]